MTLNDLRVLIRLYVPAAKIARVTNATLDVLINQGVDIINMYPHAGKKFYEKVLSELEGSKTRLFGLTILTHYTDADTQRLYGRDLRDTVRMFTEMNVEYGVHGIILPGTALDVVKDILLMKIFKELKIPNGVWQDFVNRVIPKK